MLLLLLLMACSGNDSRATERSSHSSRHTYKLDDESIKREREKKYEGRNKPVDGFDD